MHVDILSVTSGMLCCRGVTVILTAGGVSIVPCSHCSALEILANIMYVTENVKSETYVKALGWPTGMFVGCWSISVLGTDILSLTLVHYAVFSGLEYKE